MTTSEFSEFYQDEPTKDIDLRLAAGVRLAVWAARTRQRWLVRLLGMVGVL